MTERDPWLSPEAVERLTAGKDGKPCKWRRLQCERLRAMNIPFKPNFAGFPLVESAKVLTVVPVSGHRSPDWGKVKRGQAAKTQQASSASNGDAPGRVLPFGARRG